MPPRRTSRRKEGLVGYFLMPQRAETTEQVIAAPVETAQRPRNGMEMQSAKCRGTPPMLSPDPNIPVKETRPPERFLTQPATKTSEAGQANLLGLAKS